MKKKPFFLLIILLLSQIFTVYSQDDNLETKLQKTKSDKEKIEILSKYASENFSKSPEKSLEYANRALSLAVKTGNKEYISTALLNKATAFYYLGKHDSCEKYCIEVINSNLTGKNAPSKKGFACNLVSIINKTKGNYTKALKYATKALDIQRKRDNKYNYGIALNNVAGILKRKGEYQQSLDSFYKALKIFSSLNDTATQLITYNNIANLYMDISNDSMAKEYYQKALNLKTGDTLSRDYAGLLCNLGILKYNEQDYEGAIFNYKKALNIYKKYNYTLEIAGIYQNIGNAYIAEKSYQKGLTMLKKALTIFKKEQHFEDIANTSLDIGNAFLKTGDDDSAYYYIFSAMKTADSISNFYIKNNAQYSLYQYYNNKGDYHSALKIYRQYVNEKDSVEGMEIKNKIFELKTKYETEKKENEIKLLKKRETVQKARNRLLIVVILLLTVIIILVIIIFSVKRRNEKQKQQLTIEKHKMEVDYLARENEYKSNQLATHALHMMQKNRLLKELQNELSEVEKTMDSDAQHRIRKLKRAIVKNINTEKDWNIFKRYFEHINPDFFGKLKEKFPQLTNYDIRLAALIKLNLNNNEIATALNITPGSVKTSRHRLKKKLNLGKDADLERFIAML